MKKIMQNKTSAEIEQKDLAGVEKIMAHCEMLLGLRMLFVLNCDLIANVNI